jgi:hypothetical protein
LTKGLIAELEARQTVREQPFDSRKPIVGPLIAWFRGMWNNVSTRWYVLPLLQQQNEFNTLLVSYLRDTLEEMDQRLIDLDRDQTALTRTVSEMSYQLVHLERLLTSVEAQVKARDTDSHDA